MTDHPARAVIAAAGLATATAAEAEKLRQVLADIRALHAPYVEQGTRVPVCIHCCFINGDFSDLCIGSHLHGTGLPICQTAAILDRAGL